MICDLNIFRFCLRFSLGILFQVSSELIDRCGFSHFSQFNAPENPLGLRTSVHSIEILLSKKFGAKPDELSATDPYTSYWAVSLPRPYPNPSSQALTPLTTSTISRKQSSHSSSILSDRSTFHTRRTLFQKEHHSRPRLPYCTLKQLSTSALVTLCRILNALWSKSLVPDKWLPYKIALIPKKNSAKLKTHSLSTLHPQTCWLHSQQETRSLNRIRQHLPQQLLRISLRIQHNKSCFPARTRCSSLLHQRRTFNSSILDVESAYPSVQVSPPISKKTFCHADPYQSLTRTLYKGLPQRFPLSPTLYNIHSLFLVPTTLGVRAIVFAIHILYSSMMIRTGTICFEPLMKPIL